MLNLPKLEEDILKFWQDKKIFESVLEKGKNNKPFVFYDGPPFATGLPHYGHILSSVVKDAVARHATMKGFYVRRRWGWDCHGLPIENLIEKELNISGKKEIEEKIGVGKFNEACKSKVLLYTHEWKKMVDRIGRWVEFDNAYKTMDSTYMESVWWALKEIWSKGLIYEGKKVLMYCPHCETPVSKAEVAMDNSYRDITEEALTVKFKLKNPEKNNLPSNTYILAWTTTPWTLPANVALAVGPKMDYELVEMDNGENYIIAETRIGAVLKGKAYKTISKYKGNDLEGLEYEPLYELNAVKQLKKHAWFVAPAEFVGTEDGTGVVHTAVMYGEDDYELGRKLDLPVVPLLDSKGVFNNDAPDFVKDKYFKDAEKNIKNDLSERGLIFERKSYTHSYPFCWRCETQVFYNAISAWFIEISKIKARLIELNEKISWYPDHLKHGRFLNILETAPDWNISRNRYWATPLPFWKCECGNAECIGSLEELQKRAVNYFDVYSSTDINEVDLHKDKMDKILIKCSECGKEVRRIPEVIDCWVESASMPFAELHFPFENKQLFYDRLPSQYIAEYIAQTRTWFYYMHVMATLLFDSISYENVVSTGTILNEKGEKLSKSKMNYTDPWLIINQYGVDTLRYYLMSSPVMSGEDLYFNDREVRDIYNKVVNTTLNVLEFYKMYGNNDKLSDLENRQFDNILDKWILGKLQILNSEMIGSLDNYDTVKACRVLKSFIDDLSTWYLRRSRDRFKSEDKSEKSDASLALFKTLLDLAKLMAPIMPFIAEHIYQQLKSEDFKDSIHFCDYPVAEEKLIDAELDAKMTSIKSLITEALSQRVKAGMRVRQPLQSLKVKNVKLKKDSGLLELIMDEVNVKEIIFDETIENDVQLNTELTEELLEEGIAREIVRNINELRKAQGLTPQDLINSSSDYSLSEKYFAMIKKETNSNSFGKWEEDDGWVSNEFSSNNRTIKVGINKIG